jgi:hypothetical protein
MKPATKLVIGAIAAVAACAVVALILAPIPTTVSHRRPMTSVEYEKLPADFPIRMEHCSLTETDPYQVTNAPYSRSELFKLKFILLAWGLRPTSFSIDRDSTNVLVEVPNSPGFRAERRDNRWQFRILPWDHVDEKAARKADSGFFWQRFQKKAVCK